MKISILVYLALLYCRNSGKHRRDRRTSQPLNNRAWNLSGKGPFVGLPAQRPRLARMLCTLPSLLDSMPSTSGRQSHAPSAQAHFGNSHVPRTAAFSKQICNRNRKLNRGQLQTLCAIKKKSEKNLVCSKTLTIKPDHKDAVVDMCQKVNHRH